MCVYTCTLWRRSSGTKGRLCSPEDKAEAGKKFAEKSKPWTRRERDRGRKGRSAVDTFVVAPATKVGVGGAGQCTLDVLFISKPYPFCASFVFLNF